MATSRLKERAVRELAFSIFNAFFRLRGFRPRTAMAFLGHGAEFDLHSTAREVLVRSGQSDARFLSADESLRRRFLDLSAQQLGKEVTERFDEHFSSFPRFYGEQVVAECGWTLGVPRELLRLVCGYAGLPPPPISGRRPIDGAHAGIVEPPDSLLYDVAEVLEVVPVGTEVATRARIEREIRALGGGGNAAVFGAPTGGVASRTAGFKNLS